MYIMPGDIKLVILTHSHFDHIGSAKDIQDITGAKFLAHEYEKKLIEEGRFEAPEGANIWGKFTAKLFFPFVSRISFPIPEVDIVTGNDDVPLSDFGIDGSVIHTPGHSPGSVSVLLKTGEAFVGCMAHSGLPFRTSPGLPIYVGDIKLLIKSWEKIINKGARIIFPSHGSPFPVDMIKKIIVSKTIN